MNATRSCNCTVYLTNPDCWKTCNNGNTIGNFPKTKTIKRVTKTIEKYDLDGKLIGKEIITEDYEDIQKQICDDNLIYPETPWIVTSFSGNTHTYSNTTN